MCTPKEKRNTKDGEEQGNRNDDEKRRGSKMNKDTDKDGKNTTNKVDSAVPKIKAVTKEGRHMILFWLQIDETNR